MIKRDLFTIDNPLYIVIKLPSEIQQANTISILLLIGTAEYRRLGWHCQFLLLPKLAIRSFLVQLIKAVVILQKLVGRHLIFL